jgi:hypothetical protein
MFSKNYSWLQISGLNNNDINSVLYRLCAGKTTIRLITETAQEHKKNAKVTNNKIKYIENR